MRKIPTPLFPSDTASAAHDVTEFAISSLRPIAFQLPKWMAMAIAQAAWNQDAGRPFEGGPILGPDPRLQALYDDLVAQRRTRYQRWAFTVDDLDMNVDDEGPEAEVIITFRIQWGGGRPDQPCRMVWDCPMDP